MRISRDPADLVEALAQIGRRRRGPVRSKYGAVPMMVDGVRFASRREARRFLELRALVAAGEIEALELQPVYVIHVAGVRICEYRGDFRYVDRRSGEVIIEDVKGMRLDVYKLKKKLVEALHSITIREV